VRYSRHTISEAMRTATGPLLSLSAEFHPKYSPVMTTRHPVPRCQAPLSGQPLERMLGEKNAFIGTDDG